MAYETDDDDTVRLRARPESHQDGHRIVNTGNIADIDRINKFGFDVAIVRGRFSAQAEHVTQRIQRKVDPDLSFVGSYAYVSYFLTDDSRPYSNTGAAFGTLTPSSDKGAWELAARFSTLDLDDTDILGGEVDTFTVGVNYYMTRDLRFTANYIMADSTMAGIDDDPNTLQLRVRLTF